MIIDRIDMKLLATVCFLGLWFTTAALEEVILVETTTPKIIPKPYVFSYQAGRFPGHVDRTHSEVSDGSGTVKGVFSYVDPRNNVRTVEYIANEHGFYPSLSHPEPADTAAVNHAKNRHFELYSKIAQEHASAKLQTVEESHPSDTVAVTNAKLKHYTLFEKIAAEHARIAAERERERLEKGIQEEVEYP